jgi:hypothetical protein
MGGCAGARANGSAEPAPATAAARVIQFDNQAQDYVNVYLVGIRGQWLLGRVVPGARVMLRVPEEVMDDESRSFWLAAKAGTRVTGRVDDDPRATTTLPEHMQDMIAQRWTFTGSPARGLLTALQLRRGEMGRR